jgi:hypothetical protein
MVAPLAITGDQILGIPAKRPERLFSGDPDTAKRQFRSLASRWHPDRNHDPHAAAVFAHLVGLHREAARQVADRSWRGPGSLRLKGTDGRAWRLRYRRRHPFELGDLYVGRTVLVFLIDSTYRPLYDRATRIVASFRYATPEMRAEVERYLPSVTRAFETQDHLVLVLRKGDDTVLLRDLLDHLGGRIDPTHVAWMISGLLSICCFFQVTGLVHAAISPDTLLVSPPQHSTMIPGGWFHAFPAGARMEAVPARTYEWVSRRLLRDRVATPRITLELVRTTGRELLGDISGASLQWDKTLPRPMIDWLNQPSGGDAFRDYELWHEVLKDSFGARRFVEMPVREADVYQCDGGSDGTR